MKTLELAQEHEIDVCNEIINEGREFQKEQGFIQWTDDYPNVQTIRSDIQNKKGYVVKAENKFHIHPENTLQGACMERITRIST